jgi:hypothetical protein
MLRPYNDPGGRRHGVQNPGDCISAGRCALQLPLLRFIRTVFVPVRVQRPFGAIQARRPAPLMVATRTTASSRESVPARSAACIEIFRITAACAEPAVPRLGLPLAEWTANPAKIDAACLSFGLPTNESAGLSVVKQKQKSRRRVMDGGVDTSVHGIVHEVILGGTKTLERFLASCTPVNPRLWLVRFARSGAACCAPTTIR